MTNNREIVFLMEIENLKSIERKSRHLFDNKHENDAEHSWHIAMFAMILHDYMDVETDLLRTIKMLLIHDLIEIYAGDTFAYDYEAIKTKKERETKAAEKLFSILDDKKRDELWELWNEFEEMKSPEAKLANACDRLEPIYLNYYNKGGTWLEYKVSRKMIEKRAEPVRSASSKFNELIDDLLNRCESEGYFIENE